ncbi:MAG: hypothetical protein ACYDAS_00150 [Patescibacteria group bacterium]
MHTLLNNVTLPIITGIIALASTYITKRWIEYKLETDTHLKKTKREMYNDFIGIVVDTIQNTNTQTKIDTTKDYYENKKKILLYAPPKIINAIDDFEKQNYQKEKSSTKEFMLSAIKPIHLMRKDLGLIKWYSISYWKKEKALLGILWPEITYSGI